MKWPAMGYARAKSLAELWSALETHGSAAQIIAGGQTLLGAAVGAMTTLLTLASGPGYAALGAGIFWAMAALCAVVAAMVGVGGNLRRS